MATSAAIRSLLAGLLIGLLPGCNSQRRLTQLDEGYYRLVKTDDAQLTQAAQGYEKYLYVQQQADTLLLTPDRPDSVRTLRYRLQPGRHVVLASKSVDLDAFTIPFKVRPARAGIPPQFNSSFNAALYLGRRLDFYRLTSRRRTPFRQLPSIRTTGLGYGLFAGIGSTVVTPDLTRQRAITDYEGFVLHAGGAVIYDARAFNVGLALGTDHLLGADQRNWIYQHRPWFGLLFGLNLN